MRVLVVEDEKKTAAFVRKALQEREALYDKGADMTDAEGIRNLVGNGLVQLAGSLVTAVLALAYLFREWVFFLAFFGYAATARNNGTLDPSLFLEVSLGFDF